MRAAAVDSTTTNMTPPNAPFHRFLQRAVVISTALALSACAIGPTYEQPSTAIPSAWKEAPTAEGWIAAAPADALDRGEWWKLFGDPVLD